VVFLEYMADQFIADLCLGFKEAFILFAVLVELVYIPTSSVKCSSFPTALPTFVVGDVLDGSNTNRSEVEL
jgi:hypothetical protein